MPVTAGAVTATSSNQITRPHLEEFFAKHDPVRGRLIFGIDATASRQQTWDRAAQLTSEMFHAAAGIGELDCQLVYYRGPAQCTCSRWISDPKQLPKIMSIVTCAAGHTQIQRVLEHANRENAKQKVNALVIISDACEETPYNLYNEARELGVPAFLFQEGDDEQVTKVYREIARISGGAHCEFSSSAAARLADLLRSVAIFAAGGVKALANEKTEAARQLLSQLKK